MTQEEFIQNTSFSEAAQKDMSESLARWAKIMGGVISKENAGFSAPYLSEQALKAAIRDVNTDLELISRRRKLRRGISPGKIAGILTFRLVRSRLFHFTPPTAEMPEVLQFQERVILGVIFERLGINLSHPWIKKRVAKKAGTKKIGSWTSPRWYVDLYHELMFMIRRRHFNQEMLAVTFEALQFLDEAVSHLEECIAQCPDHDKSAFGQRLSA